MFSPTLLQFSSILLLGAPFLMAAPQPSALFSDHAVLQGGRPIPVWGTASPGEKLSVEFDDQKVTTVADGDGSWKVELAALRPGTTGELKIIGNTTYLARNLLVGEVWLCSGQSNMGLSIKRSENGAQEIAAARYPQIRMFRLDRTSSRTPRREPKGKWVLCEPANVAGWTAVGYFFGRILHRQSGLPVGLIQASWGGTDIEGWMSEEAVAASASGNAVNERWKQWVADYPSALAKYEAATALRFGNENGEDDGATSSANLPRPKGPESPSHPGNLFNGMIHPLIPYALRGIVWYQGENNVLRASEYRELMIHLIRDWRARWKAPELPFLYVQLPNYAAKKPNGTGWALFREIQESVLSEPATRMAVTIDLGASDTVHPVRKREVGERLALLARKYVYGEEIEAEGPKFESVQGEGRTLQLRFKSGAHPIVLRATSEESGFEIAGADKQFHAAEATLDGSKVILSNPKVPAPRFARYAWKNDPPVTLFDSSGLPAAPFRTDQ